MNWLENEDWNNNLQYFVSFEIRLMLNLLLYLYLKTGDVRRTNALVPVMPKF